MAGNFQPPFCRCKQLRSNRSWRNRAGIAGTGADTTNAGGGNLRRQAVGHGAVVLNLQAVAGFVGAGVVGVHLDLLRILTVADQQGAAADVQTWAVRVEVRSQSQSQLQELFQVLLQELLQQLFQEVLHMVMNLLSKFWDPCQFMGKPGKG